MLSDALVATDPDDPRFDAAKFRFSNYSSIKGNESQFNRAILKMLPPGTPKAYFDKILVKQAGARVTRNQTTPHHEAGESDYTYIWSPSGLGGWLVNVVFDADNKSVALIMNPSKPAYGVNRYLQGNKPREKNRSINQSNSLEEDSHE